MTPQKLPKHSINTDRTNIGKCYELAIRGGKKGTAILYHHGIETERVDLSDTPAKRILIVRLVERKVNQTRLAEILNISRQTIHNYVERKEHFGLEGLINSCHGSPNTSLAEQKKENMANRPSGDLSRKLEEIRRKKRLDERKIQESKPSQRILPFIVEGKDEVKCISPEDQPFVEKHDWLESRYAGVFVYIVHMFSESKLLSLLSGYFGNGYKIFMVFILMAAKNIRSLEQLKNVSSREAGIVLGLGCIPSKPVVWGWFYRAAHLNVAQKVLNDFFRYQIRDGLVGCFFLFTDGHLLPYTGKEQVHCGYSTQRSIPLPGQTNMVTCDVSGRIVDFNIQEGTGNLRNHISVFFDKWKNDIPKSAIHVFDREGYGSDFFFGLKSKGICFVTWDKHVNHGLLAKIEDNKFTEQLELNGKQYRYFEQTKEFTVSTDAGKETFLLRHFILWNIGSKRRTAGLAYTGDHDITGDDCIIGILNRWGASENTFKHIKERHPYHYHPGFKLVTSEKQDVANPILKELKKLVKTARNGLVKLKVKFADAKPALNKDGSTRKNSTHNALKKKISETEIQLEEMREKAGKEPDRVKTSDLEDYREYKQVDNEGKKLFDFITSSVWNSRKDMVDLLRPHWNQENEIVDLFYAITACQGWIRSNKEEVRVRLEPLEQPRRRFAQEQLCRKLTYLATRLPMGKLLVMEVGDDPR
jgi:transposase